MTAAQDLAANAATPLFSFDFVGPGASGVALLDGTAVQVFKNEQHVRIRGAVSAGNHMFNLKLVKPAALTFMSSNEQFKYCRG
jgi:hypothetical protein